MARTDLSSRPKQRDNHAARPSSTGWYLLITIGEYGLLLLEWSISSYREMDLLNFEQRNFVEEYKPAIWDCILCLPGLRPLQRWLTRLSNSSYDPTVGTPFFELPDEILLMIVEHLQPGCAHRNCRSSIEARRNVLNLGKTSRRLYHLAMPHLYEDVAIVHGWSRSCRALQTILASSNIQSNVQTLKIALHISLGTQWMPTTTVARKLALVLPILPKLHTLHPQLPSIHANKLTNELVRTSLSLPTVRNLVLGAGMEFIVPHCPNVILISSVGNRTQVSPMADFPYHRHAFHLISAAGTAGKLRQFHLHTKWDLSTLQKVHHAMPRLESLSLLDALAWVEPRDLLPALKSFKRLKHLALPVLRNLNIA